MPDDGCELVETDAYDDGWHVGDYAYWEGCGGNAAALVVAAESSEGGYVILLAVQAVSDDDLAATDRILGSFYAKF